MSLRKARAAARAELRAQEAAARHPHLARRREDNYEGDNGNEGEEEVGFVLGEYGKEMKHLQSILDLFIEAFSDLLGDNMDDDKHQQQPAEDPEEAEEDINEEDIEEEDHNSDDDENDENEEENQDDDEENEQDGQHSLLKKRIQQVKSALYDRDYSRAFGSLENLEAYVLRWSPGRALGYYDLIRRKPYLKSQEDEDDDEESTSHKGRNTSKSGKNSKGKGKDKTREKEKEKEKQDKIGDLIGKLIFKKYGLLEDQEESVNTAGEHSKQLNVMCIGGGAGAEIVAFASLLKDIRSEAAQKLQQGSLDEDQEDDEESLEEAAETLENESQTLSEYKMNVTAIDIADWTPVVEKLETTINKSWFSVPSSLSSQSLESDLEHLSFSTPFSVKFHHSDVLDHFTAQSARRSLTQQNVVTVFFTLNELFQADRQKTLNFLQTLKICCNKPGTLIVFVESAGSYSNIQVGNKVFPVQFMINYVLTGPVPVNEPKSENPERQRPPQKKVLWNRIYHSDSSWHRVPEAKSFFSAASSTYDLVSSLSARQLSTIDPEELAHLEYPLKLENMRYFVSVFERV